MKPLETVWNEFFPAMNQPDDLDNIDYSDTDDWKVKNYADTDLDDLIEKEETDAINVDGLGLFEMVSYCFPKLRWPRKTEGC